MGNSPSNANPNATYSWCCHRCMLPLSYELRFANLSRRESMVVHPCRKQMPKLRTSEVLEKVRYHGSREDRRALDGEDRLDGIE
jgi:hypothetical protein